MNDHWSAKYIGIPWIAHGRSMRGMDCWGLVHFVLRHEARVETASFARDYIDPLERAEIAAIVAGQIRDSFWSEIDPQEARAFDVVLFGAPAGGLHIGIVALPDRMLHVASGRLSELAWLDRGPWARRSASLWRHCGLAA